MTDEELPVIDPADLDEAIRREGTVVGVVLAAGGSSRFGDANKLLADIEGEPMVRRAVGTYLDSDLESVIAVLGDEADAVGEAIANLEVSTVRNDEWAAGQSTSVLAGLREANRRDADAVIFGLGDMPWIRPDTVDLVLEAYRHTDAAAVAAAYEGRRGNPVMFAKPTFDALAGISGDRGGRAVLLGHPDAVAIETGDPGVHRDVDREADLPADR